MVKKIQNKSMTLLNIKSEIFRILTKSEICTEKSAIKWEQGLITLCANENEYIRANAILCFGTLARRFKKLNNLKTIKIIIEKSLEVDTDFVKGSADSTKDDIELFLR
jgi:hypothetical protein